MSGLYIHVPFCRSKCAYCDFYSIGGSPERHKAYLNALVAEWEMRRGELPGPTSTIYIGGGTPSVIHPDLWRPILDRLPQPQGEFTIEANPDDVTPEWVEAIHSLGVNRVSMGVQSLDSGLLSLMGRRHSPSRAIEAVKTLRRGGIDNISLDLIYGIPGQTIAKWEESLSEILRLRPEHLSAYILSYEPGTRLTRMAEEGQIIPLTDDAVLEMYTHLCETTLEAGYLHYEISNFALPGHQARHNSSYWDGTPYLGLGPGAHSWDGKRTRRANPSSLRQWSEALAAGRAPFEEEIETDDSLFNDTVITHLRTSFGIKATPQLTALAAPFLRDGSMLLRDGYLRIAEASWPVADSIMEAFIRV